MEIQMTKTFKTIELPINFGLEVVPVRMTKPEIFKSHGDCDHGYVHIEGLDDKTLSNDGPYIGKMLELAQELLKGLRDQVDEVNGDAIKIEDGERVKKYLTFAQKYVGFAFETYYKKAMDLK